MYIVQLFILKARADRADKCRDNDITKLEIEFDGKEVRDFFDDKRQEIHDIVKDLLQRFNLKTPYCMAANNLKYFYFICKLVSIKENS